MRLRGFWIVAAVVLLASVEVSPSRAAEPRVEPGMSEKIVTDERVGGFRRSYRLHVPAGWQGEPRPLVIALHGGFATARILERQSSFSEVADEHGFFVAYPNGIGIFSLLRHWNGGFCCGKAMRDELDDVAYIDRVKDRVVEAYGIDPQRVYLVGYSNGGFLAHRYAALHGDRLAGLGIWASTLGSLDRPERTYDPPTPVAPLPVFIAHGNADDRLPFEIPQARNGQRLLGAVGSAGYWVEASGCTSDPRTSTGHDGATRRRTWCSDSPHPVVLLEIDGWGHEWPGPKRTDKRPPADPLRGFHLAREMWEFFAR